MLFEGFITTSRWVFAAYGRAGTPGYRHKIGIGCEMCGRGESAAGYLCQESGCGPDTDSGHAGQDRVKRVSKNPLFDLKGHLVSLLTQRDELECQAR